MYILGDTLPMVMGDNACNECLNLLGSRTAKHPRVLLKMERIAPFLSPSYHSPGMQKCLFHPILGSKEYLHLSSNIEFSIFFH